MFNFSDSLQRQATELDKELRLSRRVIYLLVKQLGGRATIKEEELFRDDNREVKVSIDGDFNRVLEAK